MRLLQQRKIFCGIDRAFDFFVDVQHVIGTVLAICFFIQRKIEWWRVIVALSQLIDMREWRKEEGQGVMSYGRGVGTGILITLWSTFFSLIFNVVYFKFINPGYSEAIFQFQMAEMERKGMPAAQIAQAEGFLRVTSSTIGMAVGGVIIGLLIGAVLSLILAAIFKSKPGVSAPPPVQA
jgi:hypothetical protein